MRRFRQIRGQKVGKFQAHGGRFGPGKVHKHIYIPKLKTWHIACVKTVVPGFDAYHGHTVDADTPVTCQKCLNLNKRKPMEEGLETWG